MASIKNKIKKSMESRKRVKAMHKRTTFDFAFANRVSSTRDKRKHRKLRSNAPVKSKLARRMKRHHAK